MVNISLINNQQRIEPIISLRKMQTPHPVEQKTVTQRYNSYYITLVPMGQKKLSLSIMDLLGRVEYHEKQVELCDIGVVTLVKILGKEMQGGSIQMKPKGDGSLTVTVEVASMYFKPVKEVFILKKTRDLEEREVNQVQLKMILDRVKELSCKKDQPNTILLGTNTRDEQRLVKSNNNIFEQIAQISLQKGRYLLTLSLQAKPTNKMFYIYLQRNQIVIPTNRFYTVSNDCFHPMLFRKVYVCNGDKERVAFNVYSTTSYPVALRNVVLTAQRIEQ